MEISAVIRDLKSHREARIIFPKSEYEIRQRLGLSEYVDFEYIFVDSDFDLIGEYDSIDLVNTFSEMIDSVSDDIVKATIDRFNYKAKDFVRNHFDFDNVSLLPDVCSNKDLGEYYADEIGMSNLSRETLETYFDFESYGRDINIEAKGGFTEYGYLYIL